ncbi:DUF6252 family protein [Gelidibacter japonicus]|jgi:hypothetical protein|uniref:DUF6252 family protein n=1 Tax=Gelidibacter japonicus TaxID=1962232 RepID=UPI0013D39A09|nr:DUF6252 family protein [Gelidibacter japonicus]
MKKLKKLLLITVVFASLMSCSKDDNGGDGSDAASGIIKAKVEGAQFSSMEITSFASKTSGGGQNTLVLQGNTASQGINITIFGYEGVGTYELKDSNVFIIASYIEPKISDPTNSPTWSAPYQDSGVVGEIKISEETSTHVIGTFKFKAKSTTNNSMKNITDGSFNLKKQ